MEYTVKAQSVVKGRYASVSHREVVSKVALVVAGVMIKKIKRNLQTYSIL